MLAFMGLGVTSQALFFGLAAGQETLQVGLCSLADGSYMEGDVVGSGGRWRGGGGRWEGDGRRCGGKWEEMLGDGGRCWEMLEDAGVTPT